MKLQLTSFITLAILYGSVSATPIPVDDAVPSITDPLLNAAGQLLSGGFQFLAPSAAKAGAFQAASACQVSNGQVWCPQSRDVQDEEQVPSITDAGLNGIGQLLSGIFQAAAPSAAKAGAFQAASACQVSNGQIWCPQSRELQDEEQVPSITDPLLNAAGQLLSGGFQFFAPSAAKTGAFQAASACQNINGQLFCPQSRELQDEEQVPSITDAALNGIGQLLSGGFQFFAPSAAKTGAFQAASACQNINGQLFCPRS